MCRWEEPSTASTADVRQLRESPGPFKSVVAATMLSVQYSSMGFGKCWRITCHWKDCESTAVAFVSRSARARKWGEGPRWPQKQKPLAGARQAPFVWLTRLLRGGKFVHKSPVASVAAASQTRLPSPSSYAALRASTLDRRARASKPQGRNFLRFAAKPPAWRANVIQFEIMLRRIRELGAANARPNAEAVGKKPSAVIRLAQRSIKQECPLWVISGQ